MQTMPQMAPVSDLRYKHREVFEMLDAGPVLLAARSQPQAVLISVAEWNATARELRRLQHLELCDWVAREMDRDPTTETVLTGDELVELFNE